MPGDSDMSASDDAQTGIPTLDLRQDPELAPWFDRCERLETCLAGFWHKNVAVMNEGVAPSQVMLLFALFKAHKTHRAIVVLCRAGYGEDALVLLRSLLELAIQARYMARDPLGERGERWLAYNAVTRYEANRVIQTDPYFEETGKDVLGDTALQQEIEEAARHAQKSYRFWQKDKDGVLSYPKNWYGMSVKALAKEVGWESHYNIVYSHGSVPVHSSIRATDYYFESVAPSAVRGLAEPSSKQVRWILLSSFDYLHSIARDWCRVWKPPVELRNQLKERGADFRKAVEDLVGAERAAQVHAIERAQGDTEEDY
jgi:hypothetical protein